MKKIKKIYLKKVVSFLLAFFLVFTQNGIKVFANVLNNENKLTQSENLNKENNNKIENNKDYSKLTKEKSLDDESNSKEKINNNIRSNNKENSARNASQGQLIPITKPEGLISTGNLSMGSGILPNRLPVLVKGQLPFPEYKGGYYYRQLSINRQIAYQVYLWLIEHVKPYCSIDVSALKLNKDDFYAVNELVLMENPEIFHARGVDFCVDEGNKKVLKISYQSPFSVNEIRRMKAKLEDKYKLAVREIKSSLSSSYSRLEAMKAIYQYVTKTEFGGFCEEEDHPTPDHYRCPKFYREHSIYGVFVEHRAICEGYSYAIEKLAKEFNIPVLIDAGTPKVLNIDNHMWNLVQMENGKWYVCDATADSATYNNGEGSFYNFLIGGNSNRLGHDHDPYLSSGYNGSLKIQKYNIPTLAQESYVKLNLIYPGTNNSEKIEFCTSFKDVLNSIKKSNLPGVYEIALTFDYNLTREEVELLKEFNANKDISLEIFSTYDPWMLRKYSLGSETNSIYIPNNTTFSNLNYDIENLYTQGNDVKFSGEITNIFGKKSNIYVGQKNGKPSDLKIEGGSFNEVHLAKNDGEPSNTIYSNDINFKMNTGMIDKLFISDENTTTGNVNIGISGLASINNIYYGENIRCNNDKKLSMNISGGSIEKIVGNKESIDANVDINVSGGRIISIFGPTVRSDDGSQKTTNIRVSGGKFTDGVYGEVGDVNQHPNNNINVELKGVNVPTVDVGRSTTGNATVKVSSSNTLKNLLDFDELSLLENANLNVSEDVNYCENNSNRLGKVVYIGSNSKFTLPKTVVVLKKLENNGTNNELILSKVAQNNAYLSLLEAPVLQNKLTLKYSDTIKPNKGDKLIKFPSGYQIDLSKFENQIDIAFPLQIDQTKRFLQLGDQETVSYINTTEGTYEYDGNWGEEDHVSYDTNEDEITLEKGKLPYANFKGGGYYYEQLTDINKKIAYQMYYYIVRNLDPDQFLDVSMLELDKKDFYATFDVMLHENPDVFWARDIVIEVNGKTNIVDRIKYYSPFSKQEISKMKAKFNVEIQKAVADINSNLPKKPSKLQIVKELQDYILKNNHYGDDICPENHHPVETHLQCKGKYVEHSAFGGIVKTPRYGLVCEGYALTFKLLSDRLGLETIFDAGPCTDELDDGAFHTWDYVKMDDGKWYIIDLINAMNSEDNNSTLYDLFLVGKNEPKTYFEHDLYLSSIWNESSKSQTYDIPDISPENYVKFEVIYPDGNRNVFKTFKDLLNDLKNKGNETNQTTKTIADKYTIILRDNYTLTEEEVQMLRQYEPTSNQIFDIKSLDEENLFSLKSETNKIYFPMEVSISNIFYDIKDTYSEGNKITIGEYVEKSNPSNENNIYSMAKDDANLVNDISINSGSWKKVVGAHSENGENIPHNGGINISVNNCNIDEVVLSDAYKTTGNIALTVDNKTVDNKTNIANIKYGENIDLDRSKNIKINILGGKVNSFNQNENPIRANTIINLNGGSVESLIGPTVFSENTTTTTNINVMGGKVGTIIGGGSSKDSTRNNNNIEIDVENIDKVNTIKGKLYGDGNTTINIKDNIEVGSLEEFDNLIIDNGKTLKVTQNLDYNQMKTSNKGLVQFSGSSKLILPEKISTIGSLKSIGTLNKLVISKEGAYLNINEKQQVQGTQIGISYVTGLLPENEDELLRYKYQEDVNINNFTNEISENFDLYNDGSSGFIKLISNDFPIKAEYKDGQVFECDTLYDALEDVEKEPIEIAGEVKFYIREDYEMTKEDLIKLQYYSTSFNNQKFIFTSENGLSTLSTYDNMIFPADNKLGEIEFRNITLDFNNKSIFASGSNLTMDESVKVTQNSNIDIYGGSFEKDVISSKLTLKGGTFNNIYGGGSSSNGVASKNIDISLDGNVLVKGNVYGGANSDKTGSNESAGTTTINLLSGTVEGNVIGGGKNNNSPVSNKIVINYGNGTSNSATNVKNIYGLSETVVSGAENNYTNINININKDVNLKILAGFDNLNVSPGVTLTVSKVLKYDAGISSSSYGNVRLNSGSNLCIPDTTINDNRMIGKLETVGLNNIYIGRGNYLIINGNVNPVTGIPANIVYYDGTGVLGDKLVKFSSAGLANKKSFKTSYNFNISADNTNGFLYLSPKTYEVKLYKDETTLYDTVEVNENGQYIFKKPRKEKGKKFIKWKNLNDQNICYKEGDTITVDKDISVIAEYKKVKEFTVTLKVDKATYKTDYVEEGKPYTLPIAPPKQEQYFIGWEAQGESPISLYSSSASRIESIEHLQPGTTITVNSDLTYDADYGREVKYDVDYGNGNDKVQDRYYEGGSKKVPSNPPPGIKIPFGKIFGGFRAIFNGIGNIIGGIGNAVGSIFRPGAAIVITPGIKLEAVWVNELHINIYDENNQITENKTIGEGFDYTIPKGTVVEGKEFLNWVDASNSNKVYYPDQKIEVKSNMDLKPVYKNTRVVRLTLDNRNPRIFKNFTLALEYAKNITSVKNIQVEFLENYTLTSEDINTLKDFNRDNVNFVITGVEEDTRLKVNDNIMLPADTKFDHIVLDYGTDTSHIIYARGHKLEMGEHISMKGTGSPILVGGKNGEDVQKSEIIVRSGRYTAIYGGGYLERSGVHGDITIDLYNGEVVGDIYAGSHDTGLITCGTTNINLRGGKVSGIISGASNVLGLENSNHVNIRLLGTTLENGQVYGGYALLSEDNDNTGDTTIEVGQTYVLNRVVGFTKLDIKQGYSLNVTEILNHKGGIRVTENSGEICLNGNSKLVVPSATDVLNRQAGWINSTGQGNKIVVDKNKYLSLTSTKDDVINDCNRVILDFKNNGTSQDVSRLLKYENKPEKADATRFIKGDRLPGDLFLKGDEISGDVYIDGKDVLSIIKPDKTVREFKTIQRALQTIKLDKQEGEYTITLLENYTLTNNDINALKDFNRNGVSFVIKGLEQNVELAISNSILLSTDTRFEDIVLNYNGYTRHGIYARGHKLEMGEHIEMKDEGCPTLIGGENGKDVSKSEIIVRSGLYKDIYGGGFFERSGVHGNVKIELLGGTVTGDIYGGSQSTGLMSCGTTDIKLEGGKVSGLVSGASKVLGLENSNHVNIQLLGTTLENGQVYGGYEVLSEDNNNTGDTTIEVGQTYTLNKLVGFTKLDIKQQVELTVNEVLNHKGGIRVTENSGEICLNGNSTLVVPSTEDVSKRQIGWIKSTGENNKIIVNKDQYLNLTSTKPDDIDSNNPITLDFKNPETSKDTSTLIKYENNKQKADATKFTNGSKLPCGVLLKDNKKDGTVYIEEEYSLTVTKPNKEVLRFKTIESAIKSVQSDDQQGEYTITLCENYTVTGHDVDSLIDFNRQGVRFVIKGLNQNTELTVFSNLILSADTKFENIVLNYDTCTNNVIFARGHKLEMGNNIRMKDRGCPSLVGGNIEGDVCQSNIIVRSGLYKDIYGGGFLENSGVRGNVNIDLYGGEVTGSIYGGSKDTGSMTCGTTTINLRSGKLYGIVSGTSKVSGLESTNAVNIHLLGTEFKNGEVGVYGGFTNLCEDTKHTGYTTIFVERPYYTVSSLVGFDKLEITPGNDLAVTEVLNHKGGIKEKSDSGQICLDGNAKLVVPSTSNDSNRQAGWLKSSGENNKIVIDKDKYLNLTSCRSDEICNPIILDFKTRETSKEISTLVKYEGNPKKANAQNFTKGSNLPCGVLLNDDTTNGTVYMEEEYYLTATKPQGEVLRFKTIQSAIQNIKSDTQTGKYTITLCKNYSLTNQDINELKNFNRKEVNFVITGLDKTVELAINNSIMLSTDTKFENIVLNYNGYTRHGIYARGHKLEMGDNISMKDEGCPTLIGGENGKDVSKSEIIVRSGLYKDIYGGGFFERSGVHGNVKIELYDGKVTGDIYGGSQNTGLMSCGTTDIKLIGGEVSGIVSGASKVLGLENSNHVNIQLLGTTLNRGDVYGGYTLLSEDNDDTGITTISIGKSYTLNKLVGFTKLDIKPQVELTVNEVLNHKGGIRVTDESGQICLNGNSTLIVPSATDVSNRQVGWIKSTGQCNKIVVDKNKYLNLTSTRDDDIDKNNPIILDFKTRETSKDISTLLKYEYNIQKADASNFKKGSNLPCDLVLKGDETSGDVYIDVKDVLRVTKPDEKVREFKTIQKAIQNIKSDTQTGEYTITLLENYTLTNEDIVAIRDFNRNGVSFVIRGLKDDTRLSINDSIRLSTDTKFEDIVLNYGSSTGHGIYARGHKLEMGRNIEMKGTGSPILIGGDNGNDVDKSEIVVNSGRYTAIYGGGYSERSGVHGNITITISGGEVIGDIYAGSHDTGLISCGTTNINLEGGTVGGLVSGASKVLGLENSNHVNIQLLGTTLNRGEVYGGYTSLSEDNDNTGDTTIYVEDTYTLNKLVGFTKLDIKEGYSLNVNQVLNHKGGIRVTENSGEICLNGSSKLIVPSTTDVLKRQAGWLKSRGENNKIVVNKDQYLNLTSTKPDEIDNNKITLDFKNPETSKDTSTLIKYENNKQKADATKFTKGSKLPSEILLKDDKTNGSVYIEEEYSLTVTKPNKEVLKFKTIQSAINSVQLDNQQGEYTITLCENYTVTGYDVDSLIDFSRPNVNFVIKGLNNDVELTVFSNLILSADTKFENIVLNYDTCTDNVIFARGHKLEMGNNIRMKDRGCPSLVGGDIQGDVCQSNIIVRSGMYKDIYGGGFTANSGVHGNVNIELYGGEVTGDIYGGSKDTGSMTCGITTINLRGGKLYGIVSGTSKVSGLASTNDVNIHLLGTEFKNGEVGVYGGFTNLCENSKHTGYTTIFVERPQYTVSSLVGFDKLEITPGNDLAVTEVLNHKGGIKETSDSGQICLDGNAKLVVPSTLNESNRQAGWINSLGEGNKIVFTTRNAYLNLTSTRDIMHQGCPVELTFDNMILNDSKTYLIRYQNNKDKLNINNFIVGKNLGKNSIFNIEDDKLYSIKDTRIYVPEASYMMIIKHSEKILGVQNSKQGSNVMQLTHPYGQYYGPFEDYSYWSLVKQPNGNYKIVNNKSNLLLTVENGSLSSNAFVIQDSDHGDNDLSQQWRVNVESTQEVTFNGFTSTAYNVYIENAKSSKVLDIRYGSLSDGAPLIQYDNNNGQNQKFLLVKHIGSHLKEGNLDVTKPDRESVKFNTMQSAIREIKSDTQEGTYTITVCKNYSLTDSDINELKDLGRSNVSFVIKGLNQNIELKVENSIELSGDTKFENIKLDYGTNNGHGIYARGHRLEMGQNITMKSSGGPILIGGDNGTTVNKSEIIVKSGTYPAIYGGGYLEDSGVNGTVEIGVSGGQIGDIYGGSMLASRMSGGDINIRLSGGSLTGIVSGGCKNSSKENLSNVNIYLFGTELGENAKVYGGFAENTENTNFKGRSTIYVGQDYSVNTIAGFRTLKVFTNARLEVKNKLNHACGISTNADSGELLLNGNAQIKIPSSLWESDRQVGWINSIGSYNKIVFTTRDAYLNLTSTRDIMHQGCPVELTFDNMILNDSKTYLIKYANNRDRLNINNFIAGRNLGEKAIFKIEDDKLYSIKDTKIHVPEESYMMIVKHSRKIVGVQNSNQGSNVMQLTHPYGQYYGPYEDYSYWKFVKLANGNYKIVNNKSHLVLSVKNGSTSSNALVIQDSYHGDSDLSQQWKVEVEGTEELTFGGLTSTAYHVYISNAKTGKVLDVRGGSFSDGAPLIQYDNNNGQNQKFLLVKHIGRPLEE